MPANEEQYMPAAWGQPVLQELEVPSGGKIQAKRLDIPGLISSGLIDEFDSLANIFNEDVAQPAAGRKQPTDRQPKKPTKAQLKAAEEKKNKELMGDPQQMSLMLRMLGQMLPAVVVQPKIVSPWESAEGEKGDKTWNLIPAEDREEGVIYADSIPIGDQFFILSWAMEGMDMGELADFRKKSAADVDGVADESVVPEQTE